MKTKSAYLFMATVALSVTLAVAQDDRKPAPPPEPPAAPNAANRLPDPNAPTPPPPPAPGTPGPDDRHGEHHGERGPRSPEAGWRGEGPYHSDGERHPDGWPHRSPGTWQMPLPPAPPKPTPYIGVITTPPPAVLTAQLGLADGFGLVVGDVLPDSPAAKAGIQRYDVLTKFNDQQLVDSGQFSTLVRALKKDTEASVTLIRKAQEQKVTVKIEERLLPERRSMPSPNGDYRRWQGDTDQPGGQGREFGERLQERSRGFAEKMHEFQARMKDWQKNPTSEMPAMPSLPTGDAASAPPIPPEDILREVRPGGVAQIRLLQPDGAVTYNMANTRLLIKDDAGDITLTTHDGKRSLVARNAKGETIFDGPIDTEEQRKALPEDVRKKIEMIEVQRKLAETPAPPAAASGAQPDVQ
jgi:membrane-associated protease RseP (regulator of RpoE activity)